MNLKEKVKNKIKELDSKTNKELLSELKINHNPTYIEKDLIGKSEKDQKWIKTLMKADEIFKKMEKK